MKMIYATGDLHGNVLRFQPQYFLEKAEMSKDDYGTDLVAWRTDPSCRR